MRKDVNQRGTSLTRLEERVISIYGLNNMDGQQQLGEGGFCYRKVNCFSFGFLYYTLHHRALKTLIRVKSIRFFLVFGKSKIDTLGLIFEPR